MRKRDQSVVRQGSLYHVTIAGKEYALFIWSVGKRFSGRVEGQSQIPEQTAATAVGVRDALSALLTTLNQKVDAPVRVPVTD